MSDDPRYRNGHDIFGLNCTRCGMHVRDIITSDDMCPKATLASRHERVAVTARQTPVAPADVVTTLATLGETVEDLKARLPHMRELHDWLVRIEGKIDLLLRTRDATPRAFVHDGPRPNPEKGLEFTP